MKNFILSLILLSVSIIACAEQPQALIEPFSTTSGNQAVEEHHNNHDEHEDGTIEETAMLMTGQCGEGIFKSDTKIYLARHEGELLISFGYVTRDGYKNSDGKLGYFYKEGQSFSKTPIDGSKLVLAGLILNDSMKMEDPNLAVTLINSTNSQDRTIQVYYEISFNDAIDIDTITKGIDSALNGDSVEVNFFNKMTTVTMHGDHPHFPECDSIEWSGEWVEWDFNFKKDHSA